MGIKSALRNDEAKSAFLSSARQETYDALALFHTHVKHTVSLLFTLLTAVFAMFGIAPRETEASPASPHHMFKLARTLILSLLFPLRIASILIAARYCKRYVAALIYAAELHESMGLDSHTWFEHLEDDMRPLGDDARKEDRIEKRTYAWPHSWILYSILVAVLSIAGLIFGISTLLSI